MPVFFLLGLLGVVICHVLKRKGYRCTTEAQGDAEEDGEEKDPELGAGEARGTGMAVGGSQRSNPLNNTPHTPLIYPET